MPRNIEHEVRENRRDIVRVNSYFRQPAPDQVVTVRPASVPIDVTVTATVYTRSLNDQAVAGHPDSKHGAGRGGAGDQRGSWSQATTEDGAEFTQLGRTAVTNALTGTAVGIGEAEVGSGTTDPSATDTDTESGAGRVHAWHEDPQTDTTRGAARFGFQFVSDTVTEVTLFRENGDLLARCSVTSTDPTNNEEVKVEVDCEFTANTSSSLAVTHWGTIADTIASEYTSVGINKLAIGTDDTDPTTSDTSLGTQIEKKGVGLTTQGESITAYIVVFEDEPDSNSYDVAELGVFDTDGTMLWRATFDAVIKDDKITLRPESRATIS